MRIRWTRRALSRVQNIADYVAAENPAASRRLVERILKVSNSLAEYPFIGREGRVKETRELVVPGVPYIVAYRLVGDEVQILAVMHAARRWPERF